MNKKNNGWFWIQIKVEMRMNEKVLKFKVFLDVFKGR
jgi:hypothetical protein